MIAVAVAALAACTLGCGDVHLLATETAVAASPTVVPTPAVATGRRFFEEPACREYDDYQSSSLAFYSLSAFVQTGIDSAEDGQPPESLEAAMRRFDRTVRRALANETVTPADAIEELALFWVATDGCMR